MRKLDADCLFININVLLSMLESLPGNLQPIFHCTAHSQLISTLLVFDFPLGNSLADVIIGRATKVTIDSSRKIITAVPSHSPVQAFVSSPPFFCLQLQPGGTPLKFCCCPLSNGKSVVFIQNFAGGFGKRKPKTKLETCFYMVKKSRCVSAFG